MPVISLQAKLGMMCSTVNTNSTQLCMLPKQSCC